MLGALAIAVAVLLVLPPHTAGISVVFNASAIYTMNPAAPTAEAMCIIGERLHLVGTEEEVRRECPNATEHNMHRGFVFPGFIDSHLHLMYGGFNLLRPSLLECNSPSDVVNVLLDYVRKRPLEPGQWLTGFGWDQNRFPSKAFPTKQDLDTAFPTTPVWLGRVDGHAAWGNSAALRAVPPLPDKDPEGGRIIRDSSGQPTGVFTDSAMPLVGDHVPPPTEADEKEALRLALRDCNKNGLTAIHNPGIGPESIPLFRSAIDAGNFTLRMAGMWLDMPCDLGKAATPDTPMINNYKDRLTVKGVKFFMDGALGSWGAAMLKPYSDRPTERGQMRYTPDDYIRNVTRWVAAGYQVATHAIGDRANRLVIDTYRSVCLNGTTTPPDLRLRIEHFQIVNVTDIPKIHFEGADTVCILPSMQPTHATSDMAYAEDRLGKDRLKGAYAWKSVVHTKTPLALGSDWPTVGKPPPLLGLYAAVTREDLTGKPRGGWTPAEKITRYEAVKGYTLDAAFAAFQENSMGTLTAGKLADFVLLDQNLLDDALDPKLIWQANVLQTFVGGVPVWDNPCGWRSAPCPPSPPPNLTPGDGCPHG